MNEDPKDIAERMMSMYKHSKYTPEERATDHAFAYDSHEAGRKFWIEVLNHINQLKGTDMKAERIANKSARAMVQMRRPFEGSNLFARENIPQHGISVVYVVYSYGEHWPLYVAETDGGNNTTWYENADKYSQSTSRHQSQCRPYENTIKLTPAQMRRCAVEGIAGVAAMGGMA